MSSKGKKIDYLKEDPQIYGQNWVCLSFLTPENVKMDSDVRSVKVRGVFGSEDEARNRCEEIRKFDTDFNVYIAPVGKWLAWCDDPEKASDFNYANDKLNNMMKSYYENQAHAKEMYNKRKDEMIADSVKKNEKLKRQNEEERRIAEEANAEAEDVPPSIESSVVEEVEEAATVDDELKNAEELYQKMLKESQ